MNQSIINQFPIRKQVINNHPLVYLDNAATTQKPQSVIDAMTKFYETMNANPHAGIHTLSVKATKQFDRARSTGQRFINAASPKEIIFTKGTTESINLVAQTFGKATLQQNDIVLVTDLEHHSNIVPWQMVCKEKRAKLKSIPMLPNGDLDAKALTKLLEANE